MEIYEIIKEYTSHIYLSNSNDGAMVISDGWEVIIEDQR